MRAPARPLRPRRRAQRTPKALPLDSMSSTLFSFDDATIFITLVILATLFVARMRSLTARGGGASARAAWRLARGARAAAAARNRARRAPGAQPPGTGERERPRRRRREPAARKGRRRLSFSLSRRR